MKQFSETKSSARRRPWSLFFLCMIGKSLMKNEKRIGLRTAPCGTPVWILLIWLIAVPIFTTKWRSFKNHRISECKSDKLKCANYSLEHTSSFGGCKIYQQNLKEKVEKIKNKNDKTNNVRQYSQVVENSHSTNNTIQALINSVNQLSN